MPKKAKKKTKKSTTKKLVTKKLVTKKLVTKKLVTKKLATNKLVTKNLVIVESPAKVRTLNKILGKDYLIKACYGHVRDLTPKKIGLDIEHDFKPTYQIIKGRTKVVRELKKLSRASANVFLASDPDREGEAIAWHLVELLSLSPDKTHRVSFNEITKEAVRAAFEHPGKISMDKVNAQQSRRFLDRIVGYKLSPLLWKKIARGLSAGRVQSVAVKFIVEREKEIAGFKPQEYWKIMGDFRPSTGPETFNALLIRLNDDRFGSPAVDNTDIFISSETETQKLTTRLEPATFSVSRIKEKDTYQSPPPPFITSTLQQQGFTQLGFSAKKTMVIAQQLYEGVEIDGEPTALITYMRTDSPRISESALTACRNFISRHFGPDLLHETTRRYKPRKRAQEAHEAIRPTYTEKIPVEIKKHLTSDQYKLYNLIWSRFVAIQMKPAHWRSRSIDIEADLPEPVEIETVRISKEKQPIPEPKLVVRKCVFNTNERKILSKGYLSLYSPEELLLPPLAERQELHLIKLSPGQNFTQPPPRYNEASLVRTLEKYGIGRPSTYVPIISTIQARGYVKKTQRKFFATELGILVTDKLQPYFADILNTSFTAEMEEKLDGIEEAKTNWLEPLREFYRLFSQDLKKADSEMTLEKGKEPPGGEKCAKCGKPLVIRWSRYGRFLACSDYPRCKNVVSQKPSTPAEVTDEVCEKCGKPMVIRDGRRGRFMACSSFPACRNTKSLKETTETAETTS